MHRRLLAALTATLLTALPPASHAQLLHEPAPLAVPGAPGSLVGEPLVLEGRAYGGRQASTANWHGKVILVDFWATWCGPCIRELPRVVEAYEKWHGDGLEVLGVSCDKEGADLRRFLRKNPRVAWPQLFGDGGGGWHPLATQYGVKSIPTMFLIDRNGICRSVTARQNFEQLIPELLAEEVKPRTEDAAAG